ncbi:MAG: lysostaphin resistance A-like protein [Bradymonadaceae bacterium]
MDRPISVGFVSIFYLLIIVVAFVLGTAFAGLDVIVWHNDHGTSLLFDASLGVGVGVITVVISQILDRTTKWARNLTEEFTRALGHLTRFQVLLFALLSGIAEEMFFRGFLQQFLTESIFSGDLAGILGLITAGLIFGGLHLGPDFRKFWPWTAMAIVLGVVFGAMYLYTGNILGPVLAHFTINFFNLYFMTQSSPSSDMDSGHE